MNCKGPKYRVVGVAGGTCSGKSTLCKAFVEQIHQTDFTCGLINLDQFFKTEVTPDLAVTMSDGSTLLDFNQPNSIDQSGCLAAILTMMESRELVVIEGHLLFACPNLWPLLDYCVFVDAPPDIRFIRRLERDLARGKFGSSPHLIAEYYLKSARPGHEMYIEPTKFMADVILDGCDTVPNLVSRFEAEITF